MSYKKRLLFINAKPLSWGLKDKPVKSGTRILVAQDLSITKVTRVCIRVCICACTHPPLEHRHLCAHEEKVPPLDRSRPRAPRLASRQCAGCKPYLPSEPGAYGPAQR